MVYAYIKSDKDVLIGTIDQERGGYRIVWKERMEGRPGNIHTAESELYRTAEEARQSVFLAVQNVEIVKS